MTLHKEAFPGGARFTNSRTIFSIFTNSRTTEKWRVSRFHEHDFFNLRITNHKCIGIHEFTRKYFNFHELTNDISSFHESRTTSYLRYEFTIDFLHFHEFTKGKKPIPACTNAAGRGPSSRIEHVKTPWLFTLAYRTNIFFVNLIQDFSNKHLLHKNR